VTRDLLVVDNGSTDHTAAVVDAFRRTAPFPVAYLREDREGHSVALNAGCRAAAGEVVVFTDDDAFPDPGWLPAAHDGFVRLGADWVYGPVVPRWTGGPAPWWYGPETARLVACLDYGPAEFVAAHRGQTFFGVNHAARRDRLFALGLYREDLGLLPGGKGRAGNDDDLFARALAAGYRAVYHPGMAVEHLIAAHRRRADLHRRTAALVAANQFDGLLAEPPPPPTVLGLPRFFYRRAAGHLGGFVRGLLAGNPSLRFNSELELIRFGALVRRAVRHRLTRGRAARAGAGGRR
jgi:glycosyltransferase involved in cell wall biosynthesis